MMNSVKYPFFVFAILLLSCSAKKSFDIQNATQTFSGCPDNGTCIIEIIENSTFDLQKDGIGQSYPKIETDKEFDLYKITYERKVDERIMDARYREVIYFQVNKKNSSLRLQGEELKEVKFTYARLCFCPGSTGYENINKGSLLFQKKKNQLAIQLEIEPQQFPHLISEIVVSLSN